MVNKKTVWFERAIFLSWYCAKADCKFCYMSSTKHNEKAIRSQASILAEVFLCKKLGWKIEFLSSGFSAYPNLLELLKNINKIYGKVWLNIGTLNENEIKAFRPYIEGICGAVECINPKLHDFVCPSKPIKDVENMFKLCDKYKLKKSITIVLGIGETINDFELFKKFIITNKIDKITFYRLKPQKNTIFEKQKPITTDYYIDWVKKTRKEFPKMHITAGSWLTHLDEIHLLLNAGADSITKFPSIRLFNSEYAKKIEEEAKKAKRKFMGTLIKKPEINIKTVNNLKINNSLKNKIKIKLSNYLRKMN